ncbi:MAG TPA: class I SAM-dependent methyltransferase [Myxococcaceae bacterium]|nr:class I SAM-dependent methyltransferase [Myxococcaceae bacterium]
MPERLFVAGRMLSAPLAQVASRVPAGRVLDIGCGHGALVSLMANGRGDRQVLGIDPDPRKIAWARASVGALANVELRVATVDALEPELTSSFDAVVVADVLYLLALDRWEAFLARVVRLLRPGGVLLVKEAEADGSWRHIKCLLQEWLMVRVLQRTRASGGLHFQPRAVTEQLLRAVGLDDVRAISLARGYTTPHVMFEARRRSDQQRVS